MKIAVNAIEAENLATGERIPIPVVGGGGGSSIDDDNISKTTTYSSDKIESEIGTVKDSLTKLEEISMTFIEEAEAGSSGFYKHINNAFEIGKVYALKITSDTAGSYVLTSNRTESASNKVDDIATINLKANEPFIIYGFVPSGSANYIRLANDPLSVVNWGISVYEIKAKADKNEFDLLSDKVVGIDDFINSSLKKYEPLTLTFGHYYIDGNGQPNDQGSSYGCDFINVNVGDVFTYSGSSQWNVYGVATYDSNNNVKRVLYHSTSGRTNFTDEQFVIEDGEAEIRISSIFVEPTLKKLVFVDLDRELNNKLNNSSNALYGKKWVACGDSYTEGDFTGAPDTSYLDEDGNKKVYPLFIGKRNSMNVINAGISGSIMALNKDYVDGTSGNINLDNPFAYQRYLNVPLDSDYITLAFGINDASKTHLGNINDTTNTSFYGAYNKVLEYYKTNAPFAKIGIIIFTSSSTYHDAIINIANKWGIKVLDFSGENSSEPWFMPERIGMDSTINNLYREKFRVSETNYGHPSWKAHEYISTSIESWLRSL